MLQALLIHAAATFNDVNGALNTFNRQFAALRGLYPCRHQHWQSVLEEALPPSQRQVATQFAGNLANELQKIHGQPRLNDTMKAKEYEDVPLSADLCLVSCVSKKLPDPTPAKDLYVSDWFQKARAFVEAQGCRGSSFPPNMACCIPMRSRHHMRKP